MPPHKERQEIHVCETERKKIHARKGGWQDLALPGAGSRAGPGRPVARLRVKAASGGPVRVCCTPVSWSPQATLQGFAKCHSANLLLATSTGILATNRHPHTEQLLPAAPVAEKFLEGPAQPADPASQSLKNLRPQI